ncbi:hypothetical protein [Kribbella sp. NPDC051620]|uniref:hypothetical protein n=1 Tax=Kribbella sp. NPDC051620 TaxID=3364120 RepID=UPI003787E5A6
MQSRTIEVLVEAMRAGGGPRSETFFIAQGLGAAYSSVGKNYGIQKHVNAALLQAEREGRQDEVVCAGLAAYGLDELAPRGNENRVSHPNGPKPSSTSRLFISHASADADLADALADLLRLGTDLPSERILCTSLEGMTIPAGTKDYLEFLRIQISDAGLVLPLFTPAFFDSEVCLIEVGAMWGLGQSAFPLIVPPVDFARVEKLLGKVQAAKVDQEKGLSELHDRIVQVFGLTAKTPMWNKKRTQFEAKLPNLLKNLAEGTRIPVADLKAAKVQSARHKAKAQALEKEVSELRDQLADMTAAKTQELFRAATRPRGTEIEEFEAAVEVAQDALKGFTGGVTEAIYEERGRGELFRPEQFSTQQDEAEAALRDDLLKYDEDNGGYYLNTDDPEIEKAIDSVGELFDRQWSDEVESWFRTTYGKRLSVKVRATWAALDLL